MNSFELEIDEKSRIGAEFISHIANEIKRALTVEREHRKITQQSIAEKIGTSRAVINREVQGLENLSARRIAELLWAIGWEPYFEARKIPAGDNQFGPGHSEKNSEPVTLTVPLDWRVKRPEPPKPFERRPEPTSST